MNHTNTDHMKGFLYSLGGGILLSTNFITAKYGLQGFNPETFSFVWTTAAAVYAFGIALAKSSSRDQIFPKRNMKAMIVLGATTGISMVLAWSGLSRLDSVLASFLWRFFPVLTVLSGVLILRERVSNREVIIMLIMLIGSLVMVAGRWETVGTGVILTLLAACAATLQLLIAKAQISRIHPNILVAYRVGLGALFTAGWTFATGTADFDVEVRYWCVTLLGAFLGPCAGFLLTFRAYRYWTLSRSSIVLTVQPLFVLPLAYIFLGTLPTPKELAGGCVILAGAFWLAFIQLNKSPN